MKDQLLKQVELASAGSATAAVRAAVFIFMHPESAEPLGLTSKYEELLLQALNSSDPEFLAAVGEELFLGKALAADAALAYQFFRRADELSIFMGSYILARLMYKTTPSHAMKLLKNGESQGHVPSIMLRHVLLSDRFGLFAPLAKWWFRLSDTNTIYRAVDQPDVKRRLWRYRDLSVDAFEFVDKKIGPDQRLIFRDLFKTAVQTQ